MALRRLLFELLRTAWEMHRPAAASTSAEASARSAQRRPSSVAPSAQSRRQPGPLSPPRSGPFGGSSWARRAHLEKAAAAPPPPPTFWPLGISARGASGGAPKIPALFHSERTSFNNSTSLVSRALWPRPNHRSKVNPPEGHICNAAQQSLYPILTQRWENS